MSGPWEKYQKQAPAKKPWEMFAATKASPPVNDIPTIQSGEEVAKNGQMMTPEALRHGLVEHLPTVGMIGGGALGSIGGPAGALAGAGLGGAAGQYAKQAIQAPNMLPDENSTAEDLANNQIEAGKEPLRQGLIGVGAEAGGQIIGKGAGLIADKAAPYLKQFAGAKAVKAVGPDAPSEIGGQLLEDGIVTPMSRPKDIVPKLDAKITEMKAELEQMRKAPAAKPDVAPPPVQETQSSWFNSLKSKKGAAAPAQEVSDVASAESTTLEKKIADYSDALEAAKEAAKHPEDKTTMADYFIHMGGQMFGHTPMEHIRNAAITATIQGAKKFGNAYGNPLMATGANQLSKGVQAAGESAVSGLLNPAQKVALQKYMDSLQGDKNAR